MTKLQLQSHTFPLLLSPRTSKITQSTNQGRPEGGGGGARDFWGLFFCASNTRIRHFFRFCTFFGGCVLYVGVSYTRKYTVCKLHVVHVQLLVNCIFDLITIS